MEIIAYIHNDFKEKFGIPRQSGITDNFLSKIVFEPKYRVKEALRGIEDFSHIWLIWQFSEAMRNDWSPTVRPPRLGGNKRVGVFATRSPFRPNPIGLSSVRLLRVEESKNEGLVLIVSGADLMDGTPIYDIKPYLSFTDCHTDAAGGFADAVKDYSLEVIFPDELLSLIDEKKRNNLITLLSNDPRPSYIEDGERIYTFSFSKYEISFKVENGILSVTDIKAADEL